MIMANRLKYFVGNWKMFGDLKSIKILKQVNNFLIKDKSKNKNKRVIFCIPHTLIYPFVKKLKTKLISVGAQNCHYRRDHGAFTGSISPLMIKKAGAKFIILGHSENRMEGETNQLINKKINSALMEKLNVVFCIGESLNEKRKNKTFSILRNQIKGSISKKFDLKRIIIAYEPIWSIGTGKIPKAKELEKTFYYIKKYLKKIYKSKKFPTVLYGGSVDPKNINFFSKIREIDGFLIGGSSRSSKKFIDIIKNYYK